MIKSWDYFKKNCYALGGAADLSGTCRPFHSLYYSWSGNNDTKNGGVQLGYISWIQLISYIKLWFPIVQISFLNLKSWKFYLE